MIHIGGSMKNKEICGFLDKIPLFTGLFQEELFGEAKEIFLKAGEQYEIKNSMAVLFRGKVEIYKKKAFLKKAEAPSVLGLATLFDESHSYISTVIPKSDTTLLIFNNKAVEKMILESHEFSHRLIVLFSEKIRYLNRRIDFYTSQGAEGKLHEFLVAMAKGEEDKFVEIPMSKLSEILDIGRASLYRAIASLEEKGCIKKQGKKIILIK